MRAEKSTVHVYGFGFRSSLSMRGSRLGYEVTSQTQAVQSTAVRIPAYDWLQLGSNQSDTSCTKYCCQYRETSLVNPGIFFSEHLFFVWRKDQVGNKIKRV
jgi:hypothetical protein